MIPSLMPPARVGAPVDEVDTPALLVDLDVFENNIHKLAQHVHAGPVRLRPHAKTHKCPAIALKQMQAGAVGVCCQKVGEAEAMVVGGVNNVLVSNQIVGASKLARLAGLARQAWIGVCVDNAQNVDDINEAALVAQAKINVLVELDVGSGRCGVATTDEALALARRIAALPGLHFAGIQAYHGAAQHQRTVGERRESIDAAVALTRQTVETLERAGLACDIVGGAGTGTFELEAASGVFNELQAGSYIFMDADYARNRGGNGGAFTTFEHSLTILTTVMSAAVPGRWVVDAGLKAHSTDHGMAEVLGYPGAVYSRPSDDHALITFEGEEGQRPRHGDKLRLIPGHCDPTVNLYDWLVGIRGDRVECLWPVTARGATR
jgi:3-hydroxy-D-aspartate aldolase